MKSTAVLVSSWALRLVAGGILLQTLYFKFTASPESVYIFTTVGIEPWGRIGTGVAELIAALLLLVPRTKVLGAAFTIAILAGAIASHLTVLGIEVMDDGGQLFALALTAAAASALLLGIHRAELIAYVRLALDTVREMRARTGTAA